MKTKKEYSDLKKVYYRPEFKYCLKCGGKLKRSHTRWDKPIQFLYGTYHIFNQAYRCEHESCRESTGTIYRSVYADGLSMLHRTYGLDVVVHIGYQRLHHHQTLPEIHQKLRSEYSLEISKRQVEYLFDEYLILSACSHGKRLEKYKDEIESQGGVVLGIDGAKPEKGQPGLYIFRDALSGCRLHCATLQSADKDTLSKELEVVKKLLEKQKLPIQAVISDDEHATVAAVADIFPDVPHGLCHIHFLKAVQKPIYAEDQKLARELKRPIRDLNKVERIVKNQPERTEGLSSSQQKALRRYLDALRGVLLVKGQAPFRLSGTLIFEALERLTASLERSIDAQAFQLFDKLQRMADSYQNQQEIYDRILEQQAWFLGLAEILDVPLTETFQWATLSGVEVAQEAHDYLDLLQALKDDRPEDAPLFEHMQKRLDEWAPGLFWTYDIHALPRTNNDLETDICTIKQQYRRITGRRTLKDYLMRYGPFLAFDDDNDDPEELLLWFQSIDREDYLAQRKNLHDLREQLLNIHRFRTDPDGYLAETERLWRDES